MAKDNVNPDFSNALFDAEVDKFLRKSSFENKGVREHFEQQVQHWVTAGRVSDAVARLRIAGRIEGIIVAHEAHQLMEANTSERLTFFKSVGDLKDYLIGNHGYEDESAEIFAGGVFFGMEEQGVDFNRFDPL